MLTGVIATSMTVVREKERGTMEQIMVSPLQPIEVILGTTLLYMALSLVSATFILVLGYLLFAIEVKGGVLLLYAGITMIILGALGATANWREELDALIPSHLTDLARNTDPVREPTP